MRPALPLALLLSGCTDAELYLSGMEDLSADRVGVTGEVCTDDVRDAGFPLKVLLLADTAAGPLFSSYDPQQTRLALMQEAISLYASGEAVTFAVAQFDSRGGAAGPHRRLVLQQPRRAPGRHLPARPARRLPQRRLPEL